MLEAVKDFLATSTLPWLVLSAFLGAVLITAAAFRHGRDETPAEGNFFVNVLWLFLGCGLVIAVVLFVLGVVLWLIPGMRDVGRNLRGAVLFVCAPTEYRLRRSRRYIPLAGHYVWFALAGFWFSCLEYALGIAYCCTLVGIYFGRQHFRLARFFLFPCAHRLMTLSEYEDFFAARLQGGR